jgi:hypothetical protein
MVTNDTINKDAARFAFDETIEHTARVAAFASSSMIDFDKEKHVVYFAEKLCHRDLTMLALSMRRLAELCSLQENLKKAFIPHVRPYTILEKTGFYPIKKKSNIWALIGVIIHHLDFRIFKTDASVRALLGYFKGDVFSHYQALTKSKDIVAACLIKSDKGEPVLFSIGDFVREAAEFINVAEAKLSDLEVYVGGYSID